MNLLSGFLTLSIGAIKLLSSSGAEGFVPTPDNVWYCKTLLLFDIEAEADSGPKEYQCACVSLLEQLLPITPDVYADLH